MMKGEPMPFAEAQVSPGVVTLLQRLLAIDAPMLPEALTQACNVVSDALRADKVDAFLHEAARDSLVALGASTQPLSLKQRSLGLDVMPLANGGRAVEVFERERIHSIPGSLLVVLGSTLDTKRAGLTMDEQSQQRISSGVPGLDQVVVGGGLPARRVHVLKGVPGSGETVLASQLCFHSVARGSRAARAVPRGRPGVGDPPRGPAAASLIQPSPRRSP
jgi:hypothetical protein